MTFEAERDLLHEAYALPALTTRKSTHAELSSTVLLGCGYRPDDPEKQFLRKLSFVALLTALEALADGGADAESEPVAVIPDGVLRGAEEREPADAI